MEPAKMTAEFDGGETDQARASGELTALERKASVGII
jgi:hypothetical protein